MHRSVLHCTAPFLLWYGVTDTDFVHRPMLNMCDDHGASVRVGASDPVSRSVVLIVTIYPL